jgi:hypothetical protein
MQTTVLLQYSRASCVMCLFFWSLGSTSGTTASTSHIGRLRSKASTRPHHVHLHLLDRIIPSTLGRDDASTLGRRRSRRRPGQLDRNAPWSRRRESYAQPHNVMEWGSYSMKEGCAVPERQSAWILENTLRFGGARFRLVLSIHRAVSSKASKRRPIGGR